MNVNFKFLWIGMCIDDVLRKRIVDNGGKILSASVSQNNILSGFENVLGVSFDSINAFRVGSYPRYKEKEIKEYKWSRTGSSSDISVGYNNRGYASHIFKSKSLKKSARKWALENMTEDVVIFVYEMHSPFMSAAAEVKKIIPHAKIYLIVSDLPQYMDLHMSSIKKILKKIDWLQIKLLMKIVDGYILYTKHMAEFLGLEDGTWMVMEGSINEDDIIDEDFKKDNSIISIMYSGVCDLRYGIVELLDAFALIPEKNYQLWITGSGNAATLIQERAKKDDRIKYFGFLPSRKDLLIKQKQAAMLVNMRNPNEIASAYCFPSKLFEYMISGNPVLSFRIPGIPEEYFNYLTAMEDAEPESIAKAIRDTASMPQNVREARGIESKKFVIKNKNKNVQAQKILDWVKRSMS